MTVVPVPAARKQEQQKMAPFRWWLFCSSAVLCAVFMQGCAQRLGLLSRWRKCVLPHERRARLWERYERYCVDGRRLEWRRRKSRCICEDGYYRDEETQNCFAEERCGQCSSARHESFNSCLSCELICGQPVIQQCDRACKPGCQCVKGYIRRRPGGRCVPVMSCPPKCPIYMTFVLNRERCPRVCNEAREDTCLASNEGPGCVCRPGFVLKAIFGTIRTNDWCVHESMCRFPDEEPDTNKGGIGDDVKGGWGGPAKGSGDNRYSHQSKGGRVPSLEPSEPTKSGTDLFGDEKIYPPLPDLKGWKGSGWIKRPEPPEPNESGKDMFGQHKGFPPLPDLKGGRSHDLLNGLKGGSRTKGHGDGDISPTKTAYPEYPHLESRPPDDWFIGGGHGQGSVKGNHRDEGLMPTKITDDWLPPRDEQQKGRNRGSLFDLDVFPRMDRDDSSPSQGRRTSKVGRKNGAGKGTTSNGVVDDGRGALNNNPKVEDFSMKGVNSDSFKGPTNSEWLQRQEKAPESVPLKLMAARIPEKPAASKTSSQGENIQESKKTNDKSPEAQAKVSNLKLEKQSTEPSNSLVKGKPESYGDVNLISHGATIVHKLIGTGIGMGAKFFSGLKNVTSIGGLVDHSLSVLASGMQSLTGLGDQSKSNSEQKRALV